jgi:hypothetical protein
MITPVETGPTRDSFFMTESTDAAAIELPNSQTAARSVTESRPQRFALGRGSTSFLVDSPNLPLKIVG